MKHSNSHKHLVTDDRDIIYGYFETEEMAKKFITKLMANSHSYNIPENYFIMEIDKIKLVNTRGEENA
jgi:hypothetical protein